MHGSRGFVAALLLAACAAPPIAVETEPDDAAVTVDGVVVAADDRVVPLPYYGAAAIAALPPPHEVGETPRLPARRLVPLRPPFPRWLFPLDFVVELAAAPWRERQVDVRLTLPRAPRTEPGDRPDLEPLRRRARAARIAR